MWFGYAHYNLLVATTNATIEMRGDDVRVHDKVNSMDNLRCESNGGSDMSATGDAAPSNDSASSRVSRCILGGCYPS